MSSSPGAIEDTLFRDAQRPPVGMCNVNKHLIKPTPVSDGPRHFENQSCDEDSADPPPLRSKLPHLVKVRTESLDRFNGYQNEESFREGRTPSSSCDYNSGGEENVEHVILLCSNMCQIEAHKIHHGKGLDCMRIITHSFEHHTADSTIWLISPGDSQGPSTFHSPHERTCGSEAI
ncbi:hypothetical protein TNCV_4814321 [Trichonephila clavipes]|nr:hypothetical protein TNCV_4814321 [Trichonephila clavipes]